LIHVSVVTRRANYINTFLLTSSTVIDSLLQRSYKCKKYLCYLSPLLPNQIQHRMPQELYSLNHYWDYRGYLAGWLADCGENELAIIQYEKCLEHFTYQEFGIAVARFNDDMAKVLCALDRCSEAIERFQKARDLLRLEKEPGLVAASDISIARCFNHLNDGLSARDFAYRALGVFESGANRHKTAEALIQLGKANINLSSYHDAFELLDRAHGLITGWRSPDFYLIYLIQKSKVKALKGLERWEEAETIERRNKAINDIMEYE